MTGHGPKGSKESKDDYNPDSHQSAPLSSLKDPALFGPPPKRTGAAGSYDTGTASPGHISSTPSSASRPAASDGGLGAPSSKERIQASHARREQERMEAEEEAELQADAPSGPFKADTTGLSTTGLLPPPKFRGDGLASALDRTAKAPAAATGRPTPSLPPRLPARIGASPPPSYDQAATARPEQGILNQGALNRLAQAGVSAPGLGIGRDDGAARPFPTLPSRTLNSTVPASASPNRAETPTSPSGMGHAGQLGELQARFARMGSNKASDAPIASPTSPDVPLSPTKKKPPPPPPKKKELHASEAASGPPPVPVASKPR